MQHAPVSIRRAVRPDRDHRIAHHVRDESAAIRNPAEQRVVVTIQELSELLRRHALRERSEIRGIGRDAGALDRFLRPAKDTRIAFQLVDDLARHEVTEGVAQPGALLLGHPELGGESGEHPDRHGHRERQYQRHPQVRSGEQPGRGRGIGRGQCHHDYERQAISQRMANDECEKTGEGQQQQPIAPRHFAERAVIEQVRESRRRDLDAAQVRAVAPRKHGRKTLDLLGSGGRQQSPRRRRGRRIARNSRASLKSGLRRSRRSPVCPPVRTDSAAASHSPNRARRGRQSPSLSPASLTADRVCDASSRNRSAMAASRCASSRSSSAVAWSCPCDSSSSLDCGNRLAFSPACRARKSRRNGYPSTANAWSATAGSVGVTSPSSLKAMNRSKRRLDSVSNGNGADASAALAIAGLKSANCS